MKKSWMFSIVLLIIMIAALIFFLNQNSKLTNGFDAELWKSQQNADQDDNKRSGLIDDLEREVLRVGMSQQEVRDILGPPDMSEPNKDLYTLGISPYGIDDEFYVIEYDEQLKVTKYYMTRF